MDNVYGFESILAFFFVICLIGGIILLVKLALVLILGLLALLLASLVLSGVLGLLAGVVKGVRNALARR